MKRAFIPRESLGVSEAEMPRTIAGEIYLRFRADILSGKLAPNAPLRSDDLRDRYNVGISPMREALSRLISEKLVILSGQRGFRVAPLAVEDVIDTMETRLVIESECLSRSINLGGVKWETEVVSAHHTLSRAPLPIGHQQDVESWGRLHKAFHMALLSGCGSPWLIQIANMLFDHAERHRNIAVLGHTPRQRDPSAEHRSLMEAALSGNEKSAFAALAHHYRTTADIVVRRLDSGLKTLQVNGTLSDKL